MKLIFICGLCFCDHGYFNKLYFVCSRSQSAFRNYSSVRFEFGLAQNLENFIYRCCRSAGYKVYVGNLKDKEIDFVLEKGAGKRYLQVAWMLTDESVIERKFGNLEKISDQYPKSVISMDDLSFGNRNGINHQAAWEFNL